MMGVALTVKNVKLIENKTGLKNILSLSASSISENFIYNKVPDGEEWRIAFVEELLQLRSGNLEVVMPNGEYFSKTEINKLICLVSSLAVVINSFDIFDLFYLLLTGS